MRPKNDTLRIDRLPNANAVTAPMFLGRVPHEDAAATNSSIASRLCPLYQLPTGHTIKPSILEIIEPPGWRIVLHPAFDLISELHDGLTIATIHQVVSEYLWCYGMCALYYFGPSHLSHHRASNTDCSVHNSGDAIEVEWLQSPCDHRSRAQTDPAP